MDSLEIIKVCTADDVLRHYFGGVYARDELPISYKRRTFYVYNTAPSSHSGLHWVVVYKNNSNKQNEFFDPLGGVSKYKELDFLLGKEGYAYASVRMQALFSINCGQYCVFYMMLRCRGFSLIDIVRLLDDLANNSDVFVTDFFKKIVCNMFTM